MEGHPNDRRAHAQRSVSHSDSHFPHHLQQPTLNHEGPPSWSHPPSIRLQIRAEAVGALICSSSKTWRLFGRRKIGVWDIIAKWTDLGHSQYGINEFELNIMKDNISFPPSAPPRLLDMENHGGHENRSRVIAWRTVKPAWKDGVPSSLLNLYLCRPLSGLFESYTAASMAEYFASKHQTWRGIVWPPSLTQSGCIQFLFFGNPLRPILYFIMNFQPIEIGWPIK